VSKIAYSHIVITNSLDLRVIRLLHPLVQMQSFLVKCAKQLELVRFYTTQRRAMTAQPFVATWPKPELYYSASDRRAEYCDEHV